MGGVSHKENPLRGPVRTSISSHIQLYKQNIKSWEAREKHWRLVVVMLLSILTAHSGEMSVRCGLWPYCTYPRYTHANGVLGWMQNFCSSTIKLVIHIRLGANIIPGYYLQIDCLASLSSFCIWAFDFFPFCACLYVISSSWLWMIFPKCLQPLSA